MGNMSWFQIAMIVLVVGGGLMQWIGRQLAEQRAKRQILLERQRAESERLRTGRSDMAQAGPAPDTSMDLQAIAARRQQQLEELRRRQQAARRGPPGVPTAQRPTGQQPTGQQRPPAQRPPQQRPPQQRPGQQIPTQAQRTSSTPSRTPPSRTPARPAPGRGPVATQIQLPPERVASGGTARSTYEPQVRADAARMAGQQAMRSRTTAENQDIRAVETLSVQFTRRDAERDLSAGLSTLAVKELGLPTTPQGWRKAIIISEILSPPVSMREQD